MATWEENVSDGLCCESTGQQISKEVMGRDDVEDQDCLWIKISDVDVYAPAYITGECSWGALVRNLHAKGREDFVIMSGRHGSIPNRFCATTREALGVFDEDHYLEDLRQQEVLKETKENVRTVRIEVVDVAKLGTVDPTEGLRRSIKEHVSKGKVVILAWCYSFVTLLEVDGGVDVQDQETMRDTDIKTSSSKMMTEFEYFAWLLELAA